jgi:hypothetical protein
MVALAINIQRPAFDEESMMTKQDTCPRGATRLVCRAEA